MREDEQRPSGAGDAGSEVRGPRRLGLRDVCFLVLGILAGILATGPLPISRSPHAEAQPDLRLIEEAWNTIQRVYVDQAAAVPARLTRSAISGMVDGLGDSGHSRFLTPEMWRVQRSITTGTLDGIGTTLQLDQDRIVVLAPMDDSPAQRAGLRAGDVILKVDGQPVTGLPLAEVVGRIAGPVNTGVELTVLTPPGREARDIALVRARVALRSVTWARLPGTRVAHLRLSAFTKGVTADLRKALEDIAREESTGLVLDLRGNAGGLVEEAVNTTSQFLREGNALLKKDGTGTIKPVPVRAGGLAPSLPMVVLVNRGTASASEMVAAALRDARRALLMGEKTSGTGTILQSFPLSDGSALLLGTEQWLTPAQESVWHRGITPDLAVSAGSASGPLLPSLAREMTPAQLRASGDEPLLRALVLLDQGVDPAIPHPASAPSRGPAAAPSRL